MRAETRSEIVPLPDDRHFWHRMNSRDPAMDSPGMTCSESLEEFSPVDVIVATAAGKPLLHFGHRGNDAARGSTTPARCFEELVSLSAACVAFRHATKKRIRSISGPNGLIFSSSFGALHVAVATSDRSLPLDYLVSLATVAVTSVFFLLSSGFMAALEARPTLDFGSKSSYVQKFAAMFLRRAMLFPIPYALQSSVSLPCPSTPSSRKRLTSLLASAMDVRPSITHALLISASPPFPHRIISSVSPVHSQFTPMDLIFISSLLPQGTEQKPNLPERVFLQGFSFNKAFMLFVRLVELRLASRDFEDFKAAVGGEDWRPDWSGSGADAVWVIALGEKAAKSQDVLARTGKAFLDDVENQLDRSREAKDLMVSMERPWRVGDIFPGNPILSNCVLGVVMCRSQRLVATVGALDHKWGIEVLQAVKAYRLLSDGSGRGVTEGKKTVFSAFRKDANISVFVSSDKYVFVSGLVPPARGAEICERYVFPWLSANEASLFSPHTFSCRPPRTPLAAFLAPFES